MSGITEKSTIEDVAAIVSTAFRKHAISAVLTGGAVVSLYTDNKYESWDLDFIIEGLAKKVDPIMNSLGFTKEKGRHFIHPKSKYFVEFPSGPLTIGEELVREVAERRTDQGIIRLLSPTDCVMDRLASFYHWNDQQALEQAIMVASIHPVKIEKVKAWSVRERMGKKYQIFFLSLKSRK